MVFSTENLRSTFGMYSLKTRFEIASLTFLYKILNNYINVPQLLNHIFFRVPTVRQRANFKLFHPSRVMTVQHEFSYFNRTFHLFNDLDPTIDIFNDPLQSFVNKCYRALEQ